ncbi:LysR family transcriptional regulator [Pseudorhodoferax sp. Leaf274]|uniref:LysR family transcriptional regulator n=1 Tax=Pseudorhodoferax sp. Leaf274 TaxID=1736318 RepID=UPI000702C78F|nr:LysR family transcriptional regulator [Pseudorhodoferax sp. Leaf274]KQP37029.1 LysR family transcriptional regulator [Pseudorhodoferax sp. Leaf274]
MRFDLTDLRLFTHIHQAGTITGGAQASHMTLASASERIRAMEDSLGVPLLQRQPRGVQPTPAGRSLLQHARQVLLQVERLQADLGHYGAGLQGQVRLLCNTSAMAEHLPRVLAAFLSEHPGISVDLEERPSEDIADALRNDLCDVGLASDAADLAGLQVHALWADPLVLVVPRGHAWAGRAGVTLAEVADAPLVGLAEHSAFHAHLAQHARRIGRRLAYRVRLRSFESVCRLVGAGIGVGIVPRTVALRCARQAGVQRVALAEPWAARQLVLCLREGHALGPAAQLFVQHLLGSCAPGAVSAAPSRPRRPRA